jgi:hypothetical protein
LLTERKHIALLGAVAALASPAVASAAQPGHHKLPARVRLRADVPAATGADSATGPDSTGSFGIGDAVAVSGPLLDPVDRYSRLIVLTAERTAHRQKVHARKKRKAREEEKKFAQLPGGVSIATLEAIAACESGGNPEAVSSEGTYRGKYQFDQGTWESVGGHGDPAQAPAAEQDYRAALLYSESRSSPWPVCG